MGELGKKYKIPYIFKTGDIFNNVQAQFTNLKDCKNKLLPFALLNLVVVISRVEGTSVITGLKCNKGPSAHLQ